MHVGIARLRMPAAVAESVQLLDIAQPQPGLLLDPGAQADLEGAVRDRVEGAERKAVELVAAGAGRGEDQGLVALDRDDGRGEADLDRRQKLVAHVAPVGCMRISRARAGTACLRPSCWPGRSPRARATCVPRAPAPCPRARRDAGWGQGS